MLFHGIPVFHLPYFCSALQFAQGAAHRVNRGDTEAHPTHGSLAVVRRPSETLVP